MLAHRSFGAKNYDLAQCRHCGQHYCSPVPTESEIVGFYQGDYHADLLFAGAAERVFGGKFRRYRDWVLQFITCGRTLDIGCSTGLFPYLLKEAGFEAEGLEYSRMSAQWGAEHYGIKIITESLAESGASKGTYDFVSMTDVLEHTGNPLAYLRTVREYLKPRGLMLITFPNIDSIESRYLRLASRILHRDWIWSCCHIPLHVWEFTPETAEAMFSKAGFKIVGFRRSQGDATFARGKLALLHLPMQVIRIPFVEHLVGTQMEFMIRRCI